MDFSTPDLLDNRVNITTKQKNETNEMVSICLNTEQHKQDESPMWNGDMGNSKYNALTYCDGQNRNECVHKAKAKRRVSAVRVNLLQIKDKR